MELIPILSTIILVATISTFILAVGAYILYKVQEKKADQYARKEVKEEHAELLEPTEYGGRKIIRGEPEQKPVFLQHNYHPVEKAAEKTKIKRTYEQKERKRIKKQPTETKFLKFTSNGYVETKKDKIVGVISWR